MSESLPGRFFAVTGLGVKEFMGPLRFLRPWRAGKADLIKAADPDRVIARDGFQALSECCGPILDEIGIEGEERLLGDGCLGALCGTGRRVGAIKGACQGGDDVPVDERINTSAGNNRIGEKIKGASAHR